MFLMKTFVTQKVTELFPTGEIKLSHFLNDFVFCTVALGMIKSE